MNYIAEAHGLWYEGSSAWLRLIQQHPVLLPLEFKDRFPHVGLLFREDYFDAATRVRRGRLYERTSGMTWEADTVSRFPLPSPALFNTNSVWKAAERTVEPNWAAALGRPGAQSHWLVVFAEKAEDAHYLTLKSKTYFGVLPEVNWEAIPAANRQDIQQALDAVVEAAPIQAPQPVIDACRNAACHMITAKFPESNPGGAEDLGAIVRWLNGNKHQTKADAADIVNRLHSRAKANASAARKTRPVSQQDANLAVDAIAFLLQDFGWAGTGP